MTAGSLAEEMFLVTTNALKIEGGDMSPVPTCQIDGGCIPKRCKSAAYVVELLEAVSEQATFCRVQLPAKEYCGN